MNRDFRHLFASDAVSQLGTQLSLLAIPVLAVQELHAGPQAMGLLTAMETIAFLVLGLPAGAWVDRWRKKRVLVVADVLRGLAMATVPLAWWLGWITFGQLVVVALTIGTATVFFDVAYQSYLPHLVPAEWIATGNARLQLAQSVSMVTGPAIAGALIRQIGAAWTIGLNAIGFALSAAFLGGIRHREEPAVHHGRTLGADMVEGLRFVLSHPLLRRIVAATSLGNLFSSMSSALLVLFALRVLGISEATLGVVMAIGSVGGLLGAAIVGPLIRLVGEGRIIAVSALCWSVFAVLPAVAGAPLPVLPALTIGLAGQGVGVVVYNVAQVSFRQRLCPRPLLGRMNASVRFLVWGTQPIGALTGGLLGGWLGVRPVLFIVAAGTLVASFPVLFSPLRRNETGT